MWDMEPRKILVAVDSDCDAALRYAVAEARRRGCGIHVTRVDRPAIWSSYVLDEVSLVESELRHPGASILAAAATRVEALLDEEAPDDERLSVSTELTHGSVVAALQALSRHACLLVLEHHGMGPAGETSTLSVTAGLAAAAHCPVVAVPDVLASGDRRCGHGRGRGRGPGAGPGAARDRHARGGAPGCPAPGRAGARRFRRRVIRRHRPGGARCPGRRRGAARFGCAGAARTRRPLRPGGRRPPPPQARRRSSAGAYGSRAAPPQPGTGAGR